MASPGHRVIERELEQQVLAAVTALRNVRQLAWTADSLPVTDEVNDLWLQAQGRVEVIKRAVKEALAEWDSLPVIRRERWRQTQQLEMDLGPEAVAAAEAFRDNAQRSADEYGITTTIAMAGGPEVVVAAPPRTER